MSMHIFTNVVQIMLHSDKYETLLLKLYKRIYPYRLNAQERALKGGMRGVGFAALLGLDDFRKDAFATGMHAYLLQRKYPHAEIAFSCPRLRPIINNDRINPKDVHEAQLLQVVTAYRLFMPFASITVSTRECARVRDNLMNIAATKISAGVSTGIGSHSDDIEESDKGDEQFDKSFYNPKGIYAQSHRSLANDVKRQARLFLALVYGFKPDQTKQSKEVHMSKQPQNNKGTAVLGSLVFMALYALGIWHNAVRGNIPFLILWSVLLLVNVSYLIFRLRK